METVAQNIWSKSKLLVKGLIIGLLKLLLLIPTHYVQELIQDREARQKEAIAEVSSKWASRQNITGPVVVIPYWPVNGYQKTMRSVKYAVLCILLTFAAFFLIETSQKKSVHPFQYGLIGLALILFYTLLLSFSEYVGFNVSYMIASIATIGLIAWFVKGILTSTRLTILLTVSLLLMYTYIFTILQLQDYALLLGSIGLFITLGVIMSFTRKMQW